MQQTYLDVAPLAGPALDQAVELQVADPVWGRDDVLWPWLEDLAARVRAGKARQWADQLAAVER